MVFNDNREGQEIGKNSGDGKTCFWTYELTLTQISKILLTINGEIRTKPAPALT